MAADQQFLREHYASLSDEALASIDRAELVASAQQCYDEEVRSRGNTVEDAQLDDEKPDWLPDANEVFSRVAVPGAPPAPDIEDARDALEAAGIPVYLDVTQEVPEPDPSPSPVQTWRVMVPGNLNLHATSVLERDIFNADFEEHWKTHLEMLSDDEVLEMTPETAFCGLFDRVERVTRAYEEELARRKLK